MLFVPVVSDATCSHEDGRYEFRRTDPTYKQAMNLKEEFDRKDIEVACVLPSKLVRMFEGQLGAAFDRTAIGVSDLMFMPASMDFENPVVETKRDGPITTLLKESPLRTFQFGMRVVRGFHPTPQRYVHDGR
jgi:hypothetical protein